MIDETAGKEIAIRLNSVPHKKRGEIVEEYCSALNWSRGKFYAVAKAHGYSSGKKERRDRGIPKQVDIEKIKKGAVVIDRTRRKTGKVNMSSWNLLLHFEDNGIVERDAISEGTFNKYLRDMNISRDDLISPEPAIPLRSLHPNHVHLIDASVCVMWDFKGKRKVVVKDRDMQTEFYKNKPGLWKKVRKVILRYICADHTTGWFYVHYYYCSGENFKNMFDFTMRAWGVKENPKIYPAHGVPFVLMIDKGAANISSFYTNLMKNLKVEVYVHTPGKPWISGAVETIHGFWERSFEGDLSLFKIAGEDDEQALSELNRRASDKCAYINAMRVHSRHGMTRFEAYHFIKKNN